MDRSDAAAEIGRLIDLLTRYNHEYHVLGRPSIPDVEYDRLFDRLRSLEDTHPDLKRPDSPSLRVGSDLSSELPEVPHTIPVLSLDKAYSAEEVATWMERAVSGAATDLSFVVEEKIDGISIVLYYEDGFLSRAVTRGNGLVGNDVTHNVRTVGSVPLRIPDTRSIAVRGEIYLPIDRFSEINGALETPYANPRNLAAGVIRRIKSSEVAAVPLTMFAYEIHVQRLSGEEATAQTGGVTRPTDSLDDHIAALYRLEELGFRRNPRVGYFSNTSVPSADLAGLTVGGYADLPGYIRAAAAERRRLNYEIDGLVVKVNELEVRRRMGYTGHHPRWAIAFKFESPEGVTRIARIEVQVGRTGRITPVARVEPVSVGGTTIRNVTLHNQEYVNVLEVAEGDTVVVSRRGDVIPAVERVVEKNETGHAVWRMVERCPSCGGPIELRGAHHFCTNRHCPAQVRGRLHFFAARDQMDIDHLGPETIDVLVEEGLVTELADLYRFDPERLLGLPGFGEKKVELLRRGILASRGKPFSVVLPALGIPELGPKVTELLIDSGITDVDQLIDIADREDTAALVSIDGIGEKTADTIVGELRDPAVRERILALRELGLNFSIQDTDRSERPEHTEEPPQCFAGQVWCVTGSFDRFKPRSLALEEIKRRGGKTVSSVSGNTTHLLAGAGAGSKLTKARDLGATIVTEAEFVELIGGDSATSPE